MIVEAVRDEMNRYHSLAIRALEQVDDESFFKVRSPGSNSLAVVVRHVGGNLKSRFTDFLTSDGEKPWRDRDSEFEPLGTRAETLELWNLGWQVLRETLAELTDKDLGRIVTIRGQEWTVGGALLRSLAHVSYHVGQIVDTARAHAGLSWSSLSIPKGGSASYNRNPNRERG